MTGLIWKDFLVMRKALRLYVLLLGGYFLLAVAGFMDLNFVISFSEVILLILPISAFSYDEAARWGRYVRALPLTPGRIVGARYLFVLLTMLAALAVSLLAAVFSSIKAPERLGDSLITLLVSLGTGLLIVDVMLPLTYRLGLERARPYLFAVIFLPMMGLFLLGMGGALDLSWLDRLSVGGAAAACVSVPLAGLLGLGVSFLLSRRIVAGSEN